MAHVAFLRSTARSRHRERGAASVETAVTSLVFFLTLLPVFDLSRSLYRLGSIQHATRAAARFATTGASVEDPDNPGQDLSREDSIVELVKKLSRIEFEGAAVTVSAKDTDGAPVAGAGGPNDFVTVSVQYDVQLFTPMIKSLFSEGVYKVSTSATFLNEEFPEES